MKSHNQGGMKMAKFECCGLELPAEEALAQHRVKAHSEQRKIAASCCGIDFLTRERLTEHHLTAHGRKGERS